MTNRWQWITIEDKKLCYRRRTATSFLTAQSTCLHCTWQNFLSSEFETKFQRKGPFWGYPNFQFRIGRRRPPCHKPAPLKLRPYGAMQICLLLLLLLLWYYSSSRFDTIPTCDGRTDGRTDRRTDKRQHTPLSDIVNRQSCALRHLIKWLNKSSTSLPAN